MDRAPAQIQIAQLQVELTRLRAANERLVSTLDAANDGIITIQSGGGVYFNIRFVELWELPEETLADIDDDKLLEWQLSRVKDPQEWLTHVARRRANPDDEHFTTVELKDGRVLERHVVPQRLHGRRVGSVITFRDITERARYEQRMVFNHLVLENSAPMVWVDPDTKQITYANPGACAHFGYAAEELIGLKVADIDPVYADEHKAMQLVEELARTGERTSLVSRHRRKDGTLRDVKLTIFLTQQGAQGMLIVSIKDITEQKRAEQEKKRHEATLDSLINSISDLIFYKDPQWRDLEDWEQVLREFAEDPAVPAALYGLGRLETDPARGFRNYRAAYGAFTRLVTEYPGSPWAADARAWSLSC